MQTEFQNKLEQIINNDAVLSGIFNSGREPNWRYFHVGRSMDQAAKRGFPLFAWQTERTPDGKYLSWVWQPKGEGWDRVKTVTHSKRKAAKDRALRMRDSYLATKL